MSVEKKSKSDQILNTFDRNISQIEKCLENDLKEVSIILIVTTFEAFLKDTFKFCETLWFSRTTEQVNPKLVTPNARKTLRKYLKKINAYDERHEIVHEGKVTEFSEDEIRKVLGSIKYLEDCLIQKLMNRELGCGSGPFRLYNRKQSF